MKIKVIITGCTGMVGEGVLLECLRHPEVEKVLIINRRPSGFSDPRLTEIIHPDFFDLTAIEQNLQGYNACFFCAGVSSVGMKEAGYTTITYNLTLNFAGTLARLNPEMVFCYVSGTGTDSSEKGSSMWARVKGKTENDLLKLPFRKVYNFRPGFMKPTPGQKNVHRYYFVFGVLYPILRLLLSSYVSTMKEMGLAMIHSASSGYEKPILEVPDIIKLSRRSFEG